MIRPSAALFLVLALAACGVDGEPERPGQASASPVGVAVSGTVSMGVGGSF